MAGSSQAPPFFLFHTTPPRLVLRTPGAGADEAVGGDGGTMWELIPIYSLVCYTRANRAG